MKRWGFLLFAGTFLFVACSGGEGGAPAKDAQDSSEVCTCSTDEECQKGLDQCMSAVCRCTCQVIPAPQGTACDDGDPNTYDDQCDGNGHCKGTPSICGDSKCTGQENCLSCPQDCGCKEGYRCVDGKCEKLPDCGNGECEKGENCTNCPADCGCTGGKVCYEGECYDCAGYCKAAGKDCGIQENSCDCGTCKPGELCDALGHCVESAFCGNGTCDPDENCASCPQDCKCSEGEACIQGKCRNCAQVCEEKGRECGMIFTCDCGSCNKGYDCKQGKCVPNCHKLCYGKECGEINGCKCGDLDGKCPEGKECWHYKCLEGCDTICSGVECGLAGPEEGPCFCGYCSGCSYCGVDNTCQDPEDNDPYEGNDGYAKAYDLSSETSPIQAELYPKDDIDWYKLEFSGNKSYLFILSGVSIDKDYDLVVCLACDSGESNATCNFTEEDGVFRLDQPIVPGSVCYASLNDQGIDEKLRLIPECEGSGGTLYVAVVALSDVEDALCGSPYTLSWEH